METGALGKKVLFLYPPPVLTEVVEELASKEFEVYLVRDHAKVKRFLSASPDSILFVNLEDGLDDDGWERYVRDLRESPTTGGVGIGILSLNDDAELKQKYLMDIQVACGFITLKIGQAKTAEILVKTLEANEARGRRKFVRALCSPGSAQVTVNMDGQTLRGEVSDFSSAGLALSLETSTQYKPGTILRGLQLAVKGGRVIGDGIVVAHRSAQQQATEASAGGSPMANYVVMFDPNSLDDTRREKLRSLVFKVNQANLDRHLETL
jgi:hypothetical protein